MKKKKGFTLIELLIVIGIIGILAAFLVPTLLSAQDRAKEAAVKSVMHSVQIAVESYNMVNESYPIVTNITLKNLYDNYLSVADCMSSLPNNPFTGKPYAEGDSAGKIMYTYDNGKSQYTITGYNRMGIGVVQQLTNM